MNLEKMKNIVIKKAQQKFVMKKIMLKNVLKVLCLNIYSRRYKSSLFPANKLLTNYVFFRHFWLQTNVTKK